MNVLTPESTFFAILNPRRILEGFYFKLMPFFSCTDQNSGYSEAQILLGVNCDSFYRNMLTGLIVKLEGITNGLTKWFNLDLSVRNPRQSVSFIQNTPFFTIYFIVNLLYSM